MKELTAVTTYVTRRLFWLLRLPNYIHVLYFGNEKLEVHIHSKATKLSKGVAFTGYRPSLLCFTYQANSTCSMSHRSGLYPSHVSAGLKGLCLLIFLPTAKTEGPSLSSQCFLRWQRAGAEAGSSSTGLSCNGNGSLEAEMGTDSQHLLANMGIPPAKHLFFPNRKFMHKHPR